RWHAVRQTHTGVAHVHARDPRRAAANVDLHVAAGQIAPDPRETLAPPRTPEAAHALDQRRFERRRVTPPGAEPLALGRLERMAEAHAGVRHGDHDHPPAELLSPMISLHLDPAAGAGVFYNILTRFRKRHSESHGCLRVESQLRRQDGRRALLNLA